MVRCRRRRDPGCHVGNNGLVGRFDAAGTWLCNKICNLHIHTRYMWAGVEDWGGFKEYYISPIPI